MTASRHRAFRCTACSAINRIAAPPPGKRPICGRCKTALDLSGTPQNVSSGELERIIRTSPTPVLVDFWAAWCGPCRMVAPVLKAIAEDRAGELLVVKLNSDEHQEASRAHKITGLPTVLLFAGGREVARQAGAVPRQHLEAWLDNTIVPA